MHHAFPVLRQPSTTSLSMSLGQGLRPIKGKNNSAKQIAEQVSRADEQSR